MWFYFERQLPARSCRKVEHRSNSEFTDIAHNVRSFDPPAVSDVGMNVKGIYVTHLFYRRIQSPCISANMTSCIFEASYGNLGLENKKHNSEVRIYSSPK